MPVSTIKTSTAPSMRQFYSEDRRIWWDCLIILNPTPDFFRCFCHFWDGKDSGRQQHGTIRTDCVVPSFLQTNYVPVRNNTRKAHRLAGKCQLLLPSRPGSLPPKPVGGLSFSRTCICTVPLHGTSRKHRRSTLSAPTSANRIPVPTTLTGPGASFRQDCCPVNFIPP